MTIPFVPRSLYARIIVLVCIVLVVAQFLAMLLLFDERARWFLQNRVNRSTQRIADAVRVLDQQPPGGGRAAVAGAFATPGFEIVTSTAAPTLPASDAPLSEVAEQFLGELRQVHAGDDPVAVSLRFSGPVASGHGLPNPFVVEVPATRLVAAMPSHDTADWYEIRIDLPSDARSLPDRVWWEMLIRLAILLAFLMFVVRWTTRPLSTLAGAADRFGRNLDEPPLPEAGPSEVARAAQAFNRMQVRLRDLVRDKARMLTAVSHDLKTPITRLRLRAELLSDEDLRTKIGRDLDEMESMVTATLDLMRGAANAEPLQRTDLVALVESLADDYEDTGRPIEVAAADVAPVEVRPQALRRAVANLVDNGLKYGTGVRVCVRDGADAVSIEVEDEGPGIPEAELERVFEPFYRLEDSRNRETGGSGLGLSIARAIAIEHAGSLALANRQPTGLRATLRLPKR